MLWLHINDSTPKPHESNPFYKDKLWLHINDSTPKPVESMDPEPIGYDYILMIAHQNEKSILVR